MLTMSCSPVDIFKCRSPSSEKVLAHDPVCLIYILYNTGIEQSLTQRYQQLREYMQTLKCDKGILPKVMTESTIIVTLLTMATCRLTHKFFLAT